MDCQMCEGNGELECFHCAEPNNGSRELQNDCPHCQTRNYIPCPRCSGSGYLEQLG